MKDPERLCEGDDAAAKLMRAMRDERPPAGATQRALVALGAGSAAIAASGGAAAAGAALGKSSWLVMLKWLGGGAALGLAVAGGASLIEQRAVDSGERASVVEEAIERPAEPPSTALAQPAAPAPETEALEKPIAKRTQTVLPAPSASVVPPAADLLAREVELLDQARQSLRAGDANRALAKLDQLASEHPRARLSAEAFVVRLQALMRAGRSAEARTLAEQHLRAQPSSPHAQRIREITGLTAAP